MKALEKSLRVAFGTGLMAVLLAPYLTRAERADKALALQAVASSSITGLHVADNQIVNGLGHTVHLRGINRSGTEYACMQNDGVFDGPSDQRSVRAMAKWHINAVRVPLNEDCWLGVNTGGIKPAYVGRPYRRAVVKYVNLLNRNGMIAVVNLHWNAPGSLNAVGQQPMPDRDHTPAFWRSVAGTFKKNSAVIFDLYNEPYPGSYRDSAAAWTCWKRGGQGHEDGSSQSCSGVTYHDAKDRDSGITYRAAGVPGACDCSAEDGGHSGAPAGRRSAG